MSNPNNKLKARMTEIYGGQWRFAQAAGEHESVVSKVIRGRRELSPEKRRHWAELLKCKPREIFTDGKANPKN